MATVAGTARDGLVDYAFRVGWAITRHAPEQVAEKLLEGAADRVTRSQRDGVRQLARNLSRAVPDRTAAERDALLQQAMRSYFRYWHEAFRLPSWSEQRIVDTVVTTNEQPLRDGFGRGSGAIVALPHMANWDLAGASASSNAVLGFLLVPFIAAIAAIPFGIWGTALGHVVMRLRGVVGEPPIVFWVALVAAAALPAAVGYEVWRALKW